MFTSTTKPMLSFMSLLLVVSSLLGIVSAQSSSRSISLVLTTSSIPVTTVTRSGNQNIPITTLVPTVFNLTITPTPTSSAASNATSSPTRTPIVLETKLDPAFGVLGILLILTGLPSAFWGHKNRWTSFFLVGFYTLSLVCLVLILKFGVLAAVNPPSKTLRGLFVLACTVAGFTGGAIAIFFWKGAKYFIGAWGGFAVGLWIQCFHNGGLISPIGLRWILYIGCGVIGFVLCTIPRIHYHILLVSTAFVGASAFILGIDCFTTAGLKEFYLWNLGFRSLFPKFTNNGIAYPVSQTMQIELGLIGAVALMGIAVQLRILTVLQKKLAEIAEEQKKRDEEAEIQASERFAGVMAERERWEKDHPIRHSRHQSGLSTAPLMMDQNSSSPTEDRHSSTVDHDGRTGPHSRLSDYTRMGTPENKAPQSPGALPALDLGVDIQENVPRNFISEEKDQPAKADTGANQRKEELIAEILTIRRSIEALKEEASSYTTESRHPSLTSRRTLSQDAYTVLPPPTHLRPPRQDNSRNRVRSMELEALTNSALGASIGRPTSAPLRSDVDWDSYVHDRKLIQPPAGVTAPIPTTPISARISMPPAVAEALSQRQRKESAFERDSSSEDIPVAALVKMHHRKRTSSGTALVSVLPPRKNSNPIAAPTPQRPVGSRTRTFEELTERHREKMRDLQAPLTQAEKEQAEILAAKTRWERSKATEKDAVNKRLAQKAADYTREAQKRNRMEDESGKTGRRSITLNEPSNSGHRHTRSLSADKLAALHQTASSSKRMSSLKVEDWQRYQQETQAEPATGGLPSRRDSRARRLEDGTIPFPGRTRSRGSYDWQHRTTGGSRDQPI